MHPAMWEVLGTNRRMGPGRKTGEAQNLLGKLTVGPETSGESEAQSCA